MTREEFEMQYVEYDGYIFTPKYEMQEIEKEDDAVDIEYTITATAEQVYQEWIEQRNQPPKATEQELFNEQLLLENAELKDVVQTLLLDVAGLKGGDLNV